MTIKINPQTVVVFDLDDTLYNEIDYLISAYKSIAKHLDSKNEKALYGTMFSMYRNNGNVFKYLEEKYSTSKEELITLYRSHKPKITPNHGVVKLLTSIKEKGGKIGIITDGREKTQKNKIEALNLNKFIDVLVISEQINAEKPNPKAYAYVENELQGSVYFYIGDNLSKDFIAAKKRNWKTIGLLDSGKNIHPNAYLNIEKEKTPDCFIYTLTEIEII